MNCYRVVAGIQKTGRMSWNFRRSIRKIYSSEYIPHKTEIGQSTEGTKLECCSTAELKQDSIWFRNWGNR